MTTYAKLRRDGIGHLERLTGGQWTDFNAHDPGITLLEALCYALTDLGYRAEHDIPDLLANDGANPYASLHRPEDILTTQAVTATDLRRLVLDVPGVKNAWIERVEERLDNDASIRGLYRVDIDASPEREGIYVRREVGRLLHKHRGQCEDFTDIVILEPLKIAIDADIEIGRVDDPARTYAAILDAIETIISPTIPFVSLAERLESGLPLDEIFSGPRLVHGFVTDQALDDARRRRALHGSDIVRAVLDVPGVRAVTTVLLRAGEAHSAWSLELPLDRAPRLDRFASVITLLSGGLPVAIGVPPPAPSFPARAKVAPVTLPAHRDRHVDTYHAVQHHLPMLYGIGELGLPDSASPKRRAQAKQLDAYLMFSNQLMANQLAQLAHAKSLFSFQAEPTEPTYFTQIVDEPTLGLDAVATASPDDLQGMAEQPEGRLARKHRFLNHLLARFGESLNERYDAAGADSQKLIRYKQAFLREYPRISGSRGTAFDGLGPWGRANPSGLEDRLRFKLGLDDATHTPPAKRESMVMVEHVHLRPGQLHRFDAFREAHLPAVRDPYSSKITFVSPASRGRFGQREADGYPFRELVEQTIRGQTPAHIGTYVLWLEETDWNDFFEAHTEWRRAHREHVASKLGISLGLDPRRYATIPSLPWLPGLVDISTSSPRLADYGAVVDVYVDGTQEGGAAYSLVRDTDTPLPQDSLELLASDVSVLGTGKTIAIPSAPVTEDLVLRVQVERLFDDTILLDAVLPVRVRANPALAVEATGSALVDYGNPASLTLQESQHGVHYRAHVRPLGDDDFFVPEGEPVLSVVVPNVANLPPGPSVRVVPPPTDAWRNAGYTATATALVGTGGALEISAGEITKDCLVVVQAHKDHDATPVDATDVQLTQAVVLLARPGPATNLVLTKTSSTTVAVTNGEPGVLYYLLDQAHTPLGKPAYFHRKDDVDATLNRGIGDLRVGRDLAVARGVVAAGANRSTTAPLEPVVTVTALPANNTVEVMAVYARTGVAWAATITRAVGTS